MPASASSSWLQLPHLRAHLGLAAKMVVPLGDVFNRKGGKIEERRKRKTRVRNNSANIKVRRRKRGSTPGARTEIPLQPMERPVVEQISTLQPMQPYTRAGWYFLTDLWPMLQQILDRVCSTWRGARIKAVFSWSTVAHVKDPWSSWSCFFEELRLWRGPMLE